ncbi:MAG: hypothetical protein QXZ02_05880 [Candidatus Bathyarchaeia archaeon]
MLQNNTNLGFWLRKVKDNLCKAGVRWAVFAGAAAYCYGSKRKVTDIDILVKEQILRRLKRF